MMINYRGTNVHAMAHVNNEALKGLRSKDRQTKTMIQSPQDVLWLRPGWNEFPSEVWNQNKEQPLIKKMLKDGMIELMSYKAKLKVRSDEGKLKTIERTIGLDDKPVRLKHFDEDMAIKVAKSTFNRDLLQRWMDEEIRSKVKKALRKQIEPLLNNSKDEDDEDDYDSDSE